MGFAVLLNLMVKIFDVLAWPLITLVYPLYASIWAIENNSISDNRNCLTYWVLYSLLWLFELTFSKSMEWLPFWPYVKLLAACYLVVPNLDGAAYVYDHFLRPSFSMTMQAINNWFIQSKKDFLFCRSDNFLDAAERYIKENGHEALEELIISKCKEPNLAQTKIKAVVTMENKEAVATEWSKCEQPNLAWTKIKALVTTENKEAAAAEWSKCEDPNLSWTKIKAVVTTVNKEAATTKLVKSVEPNPAWTEKEACTAMQGKEITVAVAEDRGIERTNLPAPKDVRKEWPCALCQVSVTSEEILKEHFRGKKHQAKLKKLKASEMEAKSNGSSASTAEKDDQPKVEPKKGVSANMVAKDNEPKVEPKKGVSANMVVKDDEPKVEGVSANMVAKDDEPKVEPKNGVSANMVAKGDEPKVEPWKGVSAKMAEKDDQLNVDPKEGVSTNGPNPKHDNKEEEVEVNGTKKNQKQLLMLWCDKCNVYCHSQVNLISHLNGKKHLAQSKPKSLVDDH